MRHWMTLPFIVMLLLLLSGCANKALIAKLPAQGQTIHTEVDSALAHYYLEFYRIGVRTNPAYDATLYALEANMRELPSHAYLSQISELFSTDLATLLLWNHLEQSPLNQQIRKRFLQQVSLLEEGTVVTSTKNFHLPKDYLFVFVPGWFYHTFPETGADFAQQRSVLEKAGLQTILLKTLENAPVEQNAQLISDYITHLNKLDKQLILVSTSKAGAETALALTHMKQRGLDHHVKAWLNIGGVLRGTPLADKALQWPASWFVKLFLINGSTFDALESMTSNRGAQYADNYDIPEHITIINYVGLPLSGNITGQASLGYGALREQGPNDGLTNIVDEILPGSYSIPALGMDHFFVDPTIDHKTEALSKLLIELIEERQPSQQLTDTQEATKTVAIP